MHCIGQTKITQIDRHISPFCWADFLHFWRVVSYHRHNHLCEILSRLVKGLVGYGYSMIVIFQVHLRNSVEASGVCFVVLFLNIIL